MQIKLDIKGDLEEYLKKKADEEFRSPTQQVMFMLTQYYKRESEMETQMYNMHPYPVYTHQAPVMDKNQVSVEADNTYVTNNESTSPTNEYNVEEDNYEDNSSVDYANEIDDDEAYF